MRRTVLPRFPQANPAHDRSMSVLVPPAQLIGSEVEVPCADGHPRRYVNLDYAASTPVLAAVWDMVEAFVPWYSSVHRGTGAKSQVSTAAYEHARDVVAGFVGAEGSSVVFVRNTTEAINVLATALPAGTQGALDARRAPRQHAPLAPARPAHAAVHRRRPTSCSRLAERALARGADRPAGGDRRLERDRRGLAAGGARRARARPRRAALRRRRAARAAPRDRHDAARASTTSRSPATSSTRRSAPARSSAASPLDGERSCTAAARSSSSRSTTSSGPTRPTATRRAHPT